ncbi:hypothetical protein [Zavarzinella formosa]|uniref:hypothetical protein n=1 Tax=Zavarzinella formosa TaxID=360055 RepID=UPI0003066C8A|nr:hypothetical protein [Zavarzinella formosa]
MRANNPLTDAPCWVYPRAKYDLDFAGNRYWGGFVGMASSSGQTVRYGLMGGGNAGGAAGTYFAPDTDGIWKSFPQAGIRRTGFGAWAEGYGTLTNYALWCRDMTNAAWVATNATVLKDQTGANGSASAASSILATANNATVLQTIAVKQSAWIAAVNAGGTGYTQGNSLVVTGGTSTTAVTLTASGVSGGVVTAASFATEANQGSYSVLPSNPVSVTGGSGTGATFNLTWKNHVYSACVKRLVGTGTIYMTLDGVTYTDVTSQINSAGYTQVSVPAQVGLLSCVVGFKLGTSGDKIAVDFNQCEGNMFATSPILTTTAAVARGPEYMAFNATGTGAGIAVNDGYRFLKDINFGTPVTLLIQHCGNYDTIRSHIIYGDDVSNIFVTGAPGGGPVNVTAAGGSFNSADSVVTGIGTLNKIAVRLDGTGAAICINGGQITTSSTVKYRQTDLGLTHGTGATNNGSGLLPTNGFVKRMSFWREALSDGDLKYLTTVVNNQ